MGKDVIIACDFAGRDQTIRFLEQFGNERPFVKIGMELFYAAGPDIVRELKAEATRSSSTSNATTSRTPSARR